MEISLEQPTNHHVANGSSNGNGLATGSVSINVPSFYERKAEKEPAGTKINKNAHNIPKMLKIRLDHVKHLSKPDDIYVSYPVKLEKVKLDRTGREEVQVVKRRTTKKWGQKFNVAIEDERAPSSLTLEFFRKKPNKLVRTQSNSNFSIDISSLDLANARLDPRAAIGEITIKREEIFALMHQDFGFEYVVEKDIMFNGSRLFDSDDDEHATVHVHIKTIGDFAKHLKKYQTEVEINHQMDVEHMLETLSLKKAELPYWRWAFLGLLSGVWMAVAGVCAYSVAGSFDPSIVKAFPILPRLMLALISPVAMHFIVIFGGEFYSGNCMFMTVGLVRRRVKFRRFLYVLLGSLMWNILGCLFFGFLFGWVTDLFSVDPWLTWLRKTAESKVNIQPHVAFFRAIPANIMNCIGIHMGITARDMFGKLVALHFPLTVYILAGFEHSIANIILVPLGLWYGAEVDIGSWIANNLVPDILGNLVGGVFVALADVALFSWESGLGNTNQLHNHAYDDKTIRRYKEQLRGPSATHTLGNSNSEELRRRRGSTHDHHRNEG